MPKINQNVVVIDAVTWAGDLQALVGAVQQASMVMPVILLGREDLLNRHLEVLRAGAVGFVNQTAPPPKCFSKRSELLPAERFGLRGSFFEKFSFKPI